MGRTTVRGFPFGSTSISNSTTTTAFRFGSKWRLAAFHLGGVTDH